MTPDVAVPFETKKANQILLKVTKMRNKKTGKVAYRIHKVRKLDYEFECEALADFAFSTSHDGEKSNVQVTRDSIRDSALLEDNL